MARLCVNAWSLEYVRGGARRSWTDVCASERTRLGAACLALLVQKASAIIPVETHKPIYTVMRNDNTVAIVAHTGAARVFACLRER
jgi:hypothetical protein